jgi:NADH-quinone oxidoreductase subunit L
MTIPVWLLILLPLAGAAVLLLGGRATNAWGHLLGCAVVLASFAVGVVLFVDLVNRTVDDRMIHEQLFSWVPVAGLQVDFGLQLDQLSVCFVP